MLVVQHENGFALVELLGGEGEIAAGDDVRADWDALGGEVLLRGGDRFDGFLEGSWADHRVPLGMARNMGGG